MSDDELGELSRQCGVDLTHLLTGLRSADEVVFWTGAGISNSAPSCAPLGVEMTTRLLDRYFEPGVLDTLQCYYRRLNIVDLNSGTVRVLPRFESVLQVIVDQYGERELDIALSPLRAGTSNANHHFFASHLRARGSHITANMDSYIETANDHESNNPTLLHFHGVFGSPKLGAIFKNIELGFAPELRSEMLALLDFPMKLLVICGYSGSDYFDVDRFLSGFDETEWAGRRVLWIRHHESNNLAIQVDSETEGVPRQLKWLLEAGASCWYIVGQTSKILGSIGSQVGLSFGAPESPYKIDPWWKIDEPPILDREIATMRLFWQFGVWSEVLNRRNRYPANPALHNQVAQALWHHGRYREALHHWREGHGRWTWADAYVRWERRIAVDQVRGRFTRSQFEIVVADFIFNKVGPLSQKETWSLDEHRVKGLISINRIPILKTLITSRALLKADRNLESARRVAIGEEASIRLAAAALWLGDLTGTHREDDIDKRGTSLDEKFDERFSEAESLGGVLNYRHRKLHSLLIIQNEHSCYAEDDLAQQLYRHIDNQLTLGADGDASRSATLPRAFRYLSRARVKTLIKSGDISWLHKQRLLAFDYRSRLKLASRPGSDHR